MCAKIINSLEKQSLEQGKAVKNKKGGKALACCADIDLFHTVADWSNCVFNASALLCVFSNISFMWASVQISNRHSVSSLLHVEP